MSFPPVSIIIPVYNRQDYIAEQLNAISPQIDPPAFEVLICDNGSTDETIKIAENYAADFPIKIIDASQKRGASYARNRGAQEARGELLLFCDSDDIVDASWCREMYLAYQKFPRCILAGYADAQTVNRPEILRAYKIDPMDAPDDYILDPVGFQKYLPTIAGCNFAVPKTIYIEVGGSDESYLDGSEDTDLAWRVQEAGNKLISVPQARVSYRLRSTPRAIGQQTYHYEKNEVLLWVRFGKKMQGPSFKYSLRKVLVLSPQYLIPSRKLNVARELGGNMGSLMGTIQYRVLKRVPHRQLMKTK